MVTTERLAFRPLAGPEDALWCARVMSGSEPWITLRRGYDASLRIVSDPTREVYLAWNGSERLGFVILNMKGAFVGYLQTICVAPEARGRGIGSWLMAFVEERVFKESPNFFLCVSSFNPDAKRLYDRLGFEVVGTLRDYIVRGHDEILMRKTRGPLDEFQKAAG
jgi:[ribosomal protein S18]-alanine N-acetyltransferase